MLFVTEFADGKLNPSEDIRVNKAGPKDPVNP
jgi:hypothetical protein